MRFNAYDCGASIITQRGNGHRYIVVIGASSRYSQYFDLTSPGSWGHLSSHKSASCCRLMSVSPYESYQIGGYTGQFQYSTRNWWIWNSQEKKHKDEVVYSRREHYRGDFSRIPEDALVLQKCSLR
jgi:hypothetical protein